MCQHHLITPPGHDFHSWLGPISGFLIFIYVDELFNLYFLILPKHLEMAYIKNCVYCIAFHMKVIDCDPQLYCPFFVFTKTCVVIRKPLCDLSGVEGPMCSRKHFRIIDWKMIWCVLTIARLQLTKKPFRAAEPVGKSSLWRQTGWTAEHVWCVPRNNGLWFVAFNVPIEDNGSAPTSNSLPSFLHGLFSHRVVKSCYLVKFLLTCGWW